MADATIGNLGARKPPHFEDLQPFYLNNKPIWKTSVADDIVSACQQYNS